MFRVLGKWTFKPMGVHHHYSLRVPLRRAISTTPWLNTIGNDSHLSNSPSTSSADGPTNSAAAFQFGGPSSLVTLERFGRLEMIDASQEEINSEFKDLKKKMDEQYRKINARMERMFYAILGGLATIILGGDLDGYLNQRNSNAQMLQGTNKCEVHPF
ncbi:hypothetical protein HOY80DRAFT_1060221 [Tuber brumale]|nr:hypothetical protein HOY80DRAFT_1060221 [Tuber brumale]